MNKRLVIRNLEHAKTWLEERLGKPSTIGDPWEAQNILVGCVQLANQCRQPVHAWVDRRKGRRSALKRVRETHNTESGNRALRQLIDLTISAVQSCTWRDEFLTGALPIKFKPPRRKPMSEAQKQARREQLAAVRRRQEEAREARFAHEGIKTPP